MTWVSQMGSTGGRREGQFGQNGQKLHENNKISIFGSKQWRGGRGGGGTFFRVVGGIPPIPPHSGKP